LTVKYGDKDDEKDNLLVFDGRPVPLHPDLWTGQLQSKYQYLYFNADATSHFGAAATNCSCA